MEGLVHFRTVNQVAGGVYQALLWNRARPENERLQCEIERPRDLARAHGFAGSAAVGAKLRFGSLASVTHALTCAAGTLHLAIDTIRAGYCAPLISGISVNRVANRHALL